MKKITVLASTFALAFNAYCQAPKFVLIEQFTQASCGPCAAENPAFKSSVLDVYPGTVRHVAYHTNWPGTDPLNTYNAADVQTRVGVYNVTGVPYMALLGSTKMGNIAISGADVDPQLETTSPIQIKVTATDNGTTYAVKVVVTSYGTAPSGTYKLRTAVTEDPISYTTPPGTNGEKVFPDVFRKFYPSAAGDAITLPAVGSSVTFNYTVNKDAAWKPAAVRFVSWVQNETTLEVLNSGSPSDPSFSILGAPSSVAAGTSGNPVSFALNAENTNANDDNLTYSLTSTAPGDWSANYVVNGNTYTSGTTQSITAGSKIPVTINVTPGTSAAVGKFVLSVTSSNNASFGTMKQTVYVIANTTDLIVSNSGHIGDQSTAGSAANWESVYTAGLTFANNTAHAATNEMVLTDAIAGGGASGVKNIYYNVGWTFPALTDKLVAQLTKFLNAGGNLMISGQDVGWDTYDATANTSAQGTAATRAFFSAYLNATWTSDGATTSTSLNNTTDAIYSQAPSASPIANFYGNDKNAKAQLFPDEFTVKGIGKAIFTYGVGGKIGGVRTDNGTYKVVLLGVGIEQLTNTADKNAILKLTHDYFSGLLSAQEFDRGMQTLGQNYPNPSASSTVIPFNNLEKTATLQIVDLTGRVVFAQEIAKGTSEVNVNTSNIDNGMYMYRLISDNNTSGAKPMLVNH